MKRYQAAPLFILTLLIVGHAQSPSRGNVPVESPELAKLGIVVPPKNPDWKIIQTVPAEGVDPGIQSCSKQCAAVSKELQKLPRELFGKSSATIGQASAYELAQPKDPRSIFRLSAEPVVDVTPKVPKDQH
jgi:hypothetical protein